MDRVKGNSHGNEEESTITVLDSLNSTVTVLEQDNTENCSDNRHKELDVRCLGQSDCVEEISLE